LEKGWWLVVEKGWWKKVGGKKELVMGKNLQVKLVEMSI